MQPPKIDVDAFFEPETPEVPPQTPAEPRDEVSAVDAPSIVRELFDAPPSPAAVAAWRRAHTQALVNAFPREGTPTARAVRRILADISALLAVHRHNKHSKIALVARKRPRGRPPLSERVRAERQAAKHPRRAPKPSVVRAAHEFGSIAALAAVSHRLPYHTWQALQRDYNLWFRADNADLLTAKHAGTLLSTAPESWPEGFELAVALMALRVLNRDKRARPAVVVQDPDAAFHLVEPYLARLADHPDEDLRYALPTIALRAAHYSGPGSTALHRWLQGRAVGA